MKLYATVTSERASKGQGGNEYVNINITNEQKHLIAYVQLKPLQNNLSFRFGFVDPNWVIHQTKDWRGAFEFDGILGLSKLGIEKGEKQKGETVECKHTTPCSKDRSVCMDNIPF
jgi:hypothetical protein